MASELKPCPFCGGDELAWAFHHDYATVKCPRCRVHLVVSGKKYLTLAGAKKHYEPMLERAWNRRAENEELKFTREFIHEHGLEFALASAWKRRAKDGK